MLRKPTVPPSPPPRHAAGPGLPDDLGGLAIFLDIDGTLIDLAETPEAVVVERGLPEALDRLSDRLEGALALVTGRAVDFVDRLFPGHRAFVSGLHGAEWRDRAGTIVRPEITGAFRHARARLEQAAARWPGVIFEDKGAAVAAHYRRAPERAGEVRALMAELAAAVGGGWALQPGKCVIELRPSGRDKGDALAGFMEAAPFHGRLPLAVGDDVTDEAMFAVANRLGGRSVRVGAADRPSAATARVASPAEVRGWIGRVTG